jgi:mutual gliding-motility protein MglA
MSFVNFGKREINFKIVYYGPPRSGKTTNLEYLHQVVPKNMRGAITILSTHDDRTLYFDFLPLQSDAIRGFASRFHLYTVPGQPIYNETRRLLLSAVDGIVFVADSQWDHMETNLASLENLSENLASYKMPLAGLPRVLQFNKRDLPNAAPPHYMDFLFNRGTERVPATECVATKGTGVFQTLNLIAKMVMAKFVKQHRTEVGARTRPVAVAAGGV